MEKETESYYQRKYPEYIAPHGNIDDPNMQIAPYKGQHRAEYDARLFHDPEPQTRAQKRREELSLGLF